MEHPDWSALMAAILADPDDDTVRLAAADFLDENGDGDRAAFIRLQCALARLEADERGETPEADELRKKERAFLGPLSLFRPLWAAETCPELVRMPPPASAGPSLAMPQVEGAYRLTWERGFVSKVRCPAVEWLRHGVAIRARQPVYEVALTDCYRAARDTWYEHLDALRGLRFVELASGGRVTVEWLRSWLPESNVFVSPSTGAGYQSS